MMVAFRNALNEKSRQLWHLSEQAELFVLTYCLVLLKGEAKFILVEFVWFGFLHCMMVICCSKSYSLRNIQCSSWHLCKVNLERSMDGE